MTATIARATAWSRTSRRANDPWSAEWFLRPSGGYETIRTWNTGLALSAAEWEAHHLINVASARAARDLIAAAARAGWRMDETGNVAALPASASAQRKLKAAGIHRPVHDSGHGTWNDQVIEGLHNIEMELEASGIPKNSDAYDRAAREHLNALQRSLRDKMLKSDRLSWNVPGRAPDAA